MANSPLTDAGPRVLLSAQGLTREVRWGQRWQAGTAAHWVALTQEVTGTGVRDPLRHRLGATLREEVAACLLGGFGIPFETGLAAFTAVRDGGLLRPESSPTANLLEAVLRTPLQVDGRLRRYRFPAQRAARIAATLAFLDEGRAPVDPLATRDWLMLAPGIGPKTASWIVRNHYGCDEVAILDVHVMRAGRAAGVFDPVWDVVRRYSLIEGFFLAWAQHGCVQAGDLDAVIWSEQAALARPARRDVPIGGRPSECARAG